MLIQKAQQKRKYTIKQILTENQAWWRFSKKHDEKLRKSIIVSIVKLLSCKNIVRGFQEYQCSNKKCSHIKKVFFTCKSKSCSSCGKKQTSTWIETQKTILPDTSWQHITFTMPDVLWGFFWSNRHLLNLIPKLAAECVQSVANNKKVTPGVFIALHTFGRDLKRNVHVHLSVTLGGLYFDQTKWVKLFFSSNLLMTQWRYKIINMLRQEYRQSSLIIPNTVKQQLNQEVKFNHFLDKQYNKHWHVHCAKPTNTQKQNIEYLGRYIKRPPIAESRLKHYDGNNVVFQYLDHKNKSLQKKVMSVEEFIGRFVSHIPDTGFRMIRYYGFLSNRLRGELLPTVRKLLQQEEPEIMVAPSYVQLMIQNFSINPLECTLCGNLMRLSAMVFGITNTNKLLTFHRSLALLKNI